MQHSWILNVISDLERYADLHGLAMLSSNLVETREAAQLEIGKLTTQPNNVISIYKYAIRSQQLDL